MPDLISRFMYSQSKYTRGFILMFFIELDKLILKYILIHKKLRFQDLLKKNKTGKLAVSDIKILHSDDSTECVGTEPIKTQK